ncbi:MAG: DUF4197 domain-containing protein [Gammaproteobacteria bacterium]|nr:DUF4197 domain-containing protein [Gammaproteobacteria bacterium]
MPVNRVLFAGLLLLPLCIPAQAGLSDLLDIFKGSATGDSAATDAASVSAPSNDEMIAALREALNKGTRYAVDNLGQEGGFLDNARVRIPMPDSLAWLEKTLRTLRQDRLADEFVASMNHAAERAVPEAAGIFADAIKAMTLEDARAILSGPDDAATRYFREKTGAELTARLSPIVAEATSSAGVTASYKQMVAKAGGLGSLLSRESTDIDGYVTEKTLDGLFLMVAEEEKRIRENPLARSSELLKKVFGSFSP